MYTPEAFKISDPVTIKDFIRQNNFATLVSWDGAELVATHLLLELDTDADGTILLNSHLARANSQWRAFNAGNEVLAIFSGPHTYISPRWYEKPDQNVPTWNYMAVHAYGVPLILTGPDEVQGMLKRMVDHYEAASGAEHLYQLEDLPGEKLADMMKNIVAIQIRVTRLEAKYKLSQNRSLQDQENVTAELEKRPDENSLKVAKAMRLSKPPKVS